MDWVEENFSTRESQFYKKLIQTNIEGKYEIKYPIFPVIIGNAKEKGEIGYDIQDALVEYHHNSPNTYCFSSLTSAFTESG